MTSCDLNRWFDALLESREYAAIDPSRNGIQVENDGGEITRVAFAVDASIETISRAAGAGAGLLFVHHGLFWGQGELIAGAHYRRVKALLDANIALYASHLPLDANAECGNNIGLARRLSLGNLRRFGPWRNCLAGYAGQFDVPVILDDVLAWLFTSGEKPVHVLPFGPREIRTAAVVSGGGSSNIADAIAEGVDLFITGEIKHEAYHTALEAGVSVIAMGHYQSETVGVRLVAERLARETGIDTVFIDVPTGL
jgi:dinuclear metal center YbgI/SA1388 family protein